MSVRVYVCVRTCIVKWFWSSGNGPEESSSNTRRGCLRSLCSNAIVEGMNPTLSLQLLVNYRGNRYLVLFTTLGKKNSIKNLMSVVQENLWNFGAPFLLLTTNPKAVVGSTQALPTITNYLFSSHS